ncbi:MAG: carboxypeptidase regulatory-like domain-containing protein, partial [Candidatus Aminicenantes bacterium]|nr:carboxypeptidase regulatory-like domain-containing protein [Candidatus Aminicenantes bacterium]
MNRWIPLCIALACLGGLLGAQQATADIYGSVVLPDGSTIPGVSVTISGDVLGARSTVSSDEGNFRFLRLLPGNFELKFELEGFKTVIRRGIRLYA